MRCVPRRRPAGSRSEGRIVGIAHELITRGWYQGDYEGPDGSVCLYGASWKASGLPLDVWEAQGVDTIRRAVAACGGGWIRPVHEWNDDPSRTFDEVLRAAKIADEILEGDK
jgi:hypothetical protein